MRIADFLNGMRESRNWKKRPTGFFAERLVDLREWARGRTWYFRLPILIYLAYAGYRQFEDPIYYNSIFFGMNLAIHEGGHVLFRPFGQDLHVAGGTIAQLSAPLISMYILLKQPDYFGIPLCLGWLSTNLIGVGVYMADARDMELPLVTVESNGSPEQVVGHDWNFMFDRWGLLDQDKAIGLFTRGLGTGLMIAALLIGIWLLWEMARPVAEASR